MMKNNYTFILGMTPSNNFSDIFVRSRDYLIKTFTLCDSNFVTILPTFETYSLALYVYVYFLIFFSLKKAPNLHVYKKK